MPCLVSSSPILHGLQNGLQAPAKLCERIFHPRWNLRIDLSGEEATFLHCQELRGEHLLGDAANGLLQLAKAPGAGQQLRLHTIVVSKKYIVYRPQRTRASEKIAERGGKERNDVVKFLEAAGGRRRQQNGVRKSHRQREMPGCH